MPTRSHLPIDREYDLVVIGSGPAGEGATMTAAKAGADVIIVERYRDVGGGCTHWATIPSKALRHQVSQLLAARSNPIFGHVVSQVRVTFPELLRAADTVIARQAAMRRDFYRRNHVEVVFGHARFINPNEIVVESEGGARRRIRGKKFIIAVGSRPFRPPEVDFSHPRIRDSDTILKLDHTPDTITIYGAGVVGCEYASIFRNLG
ncbi:MAG: FAD-dependent oxidoreductase, partial [Deltaproteobacteria bacterium]|nr:FAD-dependent oxidoreductase [Deltaproteobacteria bacterium]